jgi:methane/ammonia monooxygenase subunit A
VNFNIFAGFPMTMMWQSVFIPLAIILDTILVISGSVFITGFVGAALWGLLMYPANWIMLAGFHEPINYNGELVTAADLMGYEYIRTGLPEYIRMIERSTLRSFAETVVPLTAVFAAFLSMIVFWVAWAAGSVLTRQNWVKKI